MSPLNKASLSTIKNWLLAGAGVAVVAFAFYLVNTLRSAFLPMQTHNDLKWIGMALHSYHEAHGHFPPVLIRDDEGNALHSWRALIEPDMAAVVETGEDFGAYDLNAAWDSPENSEAVLQHRFGTHPYQFLAVVGLHAAWTTDGTRSIKDFEDGTSNTILVIGIRNTGISWHQPVDLTAEDGKLFLNGEPLDASQEMFVLCADGSVRHCGAGIPPDQLAAMISIKGGDKVDPR